MNQIMKTEGKAGSRAMKARRIDLLAIGVGVIVVVVLILVTGKEKAKWIPTDEKHRPFYEAVKRGDNRAGIEGGCVSCHKTFPPKHPPKEQCLLCHRLHR
jgi:hypothetical protein